MTLTRTHVRLAQSRKGGIRREQLALIGVQWPPAKGWLRKIVGHDLPDETVGLFVGMGEGGKQPKVKGRHVVDLHFPDGIERKTANVIASFHAFLQNLERSELTAAAPVLSQVFAKVRQRVGG